MAYHIGPPNKPMKLTVAFGARIEQLLKGSPDEALLARKESIRRWRSLAR